jgi:predicted RNA methylase
LMMPLDSSEKRQLAMTYLLIFRSFYPQKLNTMFGLEKKVGVRRAMVFERPPVLKTLFEELGLKMPKEWGSALARASEQFKAEKQAKSSAQEAIEDAAAAKVSAAMPYAIVTSEAAYANSSTQPYSLEASEFSILQPTGGGNGKVIFSIPLNSHQALMELNDDDAYAKALEDTNLLKYVEEDRKTSPAYSFGSVEEYDAAPAEIRGKIDYYFSFLPKEKRFLIETDKVALFSITAPALADAQTKIILDTYKEFKLPQDGPIYITDATACVGGNSFSFAKAGMEVRAFEISPQRAVMLAHNVLTTGYQNNVSVYNGDYTKLYLTAETDIVFMDPPWGGRDYKDKESLDLFLGTTNINDLVVKLTGGTQEAPTPTVFAKLVAIKAPLNYNIKGLQFALMNANQNAQIRKIIPQDKMQLILIVSDWKPGKESASPPYKNGSASPPYILGNGSASPPREYILILGNGSAPVYKATNENAGAFTPPYSAPQGGYRRFMTRKQHRLNRNRTLKRISTPPDFLRAFSSVWERHAARKA